MTDQSALLALADKLEKATGPSKELDTLIADAVMERVNMRMGEEEQDDGSWKPCYRLGYGLNGARWSHPPQFTDSVDCALMLMPANLSPSVGQNVHHKHWNAFALTVVDGEPVTVSEATGSIAAASVCAAALRARAA